MESLKEDHRQSRKNTGALETAVNEYRDGEDTSERR